MMRLLYIIIAGLYHVIAVSRSCEPKARQLAKQSQANLSLRAKRGNLMIEGIWPDARQGDCFVAALLAMTFSLRVIAVSRSCEPKAWQAVKQSHDRRNMA